MRGVPMVATSPIQYDDHSTVSSAPSANNQQQAGGPPLELQQPAGAPLQQAEPTAASPQQRHYQPAANSVQSPAGQASDILAYQPPWKNLIEYAHQQQQQSAAAPPDRMSTASPRYQQLIGQVSIAPTTALI